MVAYCSQKRSPPMSETEARTIASETFLFGYQPAIIPLRGQWYLSVRGDGADDKTIERRLHELRRGV
jgi:hypothetical protein